MTLAHVLGIEARRQRGRAHEVTEHDGQLPALGGVVRLRFGLCSWRTRDRFVMGAFQSGDRLEQAFSVPEEYAKLSEVAVVQFKQDFRVHRVVAKCGLVLAESEAS